LSSSPPDEVDEAARVAKERLGRVLNQKYRLDRVLGVGGMAAVYAATHRNGSAKAVKMLHPWISAHRELRNRFLAEGYTANRIRHPSIVVVHDDDVDAEGAAYLVMDLLEGQTLEARRLEAGGRLPAPEVLSAAHALLDVLALAHDAGIVHRDLKPENLFLTTEGVVKVLDFGIARVRDLSGSASRATRTGTAMGTPAFMPPEQALGEVDRIGPRTDLWAVGATMFTLLSGRYVHEATTAQAIVVAAAMLPALPLARAVPDVPRAVAALVDRALAFDMADRWPDARAMQAAVAAAYHHHPSAAPEPARIADVATEILVDDARPVAAPPTVPLSPEHFRPAPPSSPERDVSGAPAAAASDPGPRPAPLSPTLELGPSDVAASSALSAPPEVHGPAAAANTIDAVASGRTAAPAGVVLSAPRPRRWVVVGIASAASGVALLALLAKRAGGPASPGAAPIASSDGASSAAVVASASSAPPSAAPSSSAAAPVVVAASALPDVPDRKTVAPVPRPAPKPAPAKVAPAASPPAPPPAPAPAPAAPPADPRSKYE
jgi:serine/threonine-protein kinase